MYYVGIDVSKRSIDVCLLSEGIKGKRKTKKLPNGLTSATGLVEWLRLQKRDLDQAHVIMEATGTYHEHLAYGLHQAGIRVSVINPYRLREFAKGVGVNTKTDTADAYVIACFGCLTEPKRWIPPPKEARKLKALLQYRDSLLADKQRMKLSKMGSSSIRAKLSALGAAMRKLVHLCYGVLHTQQPYDKHYQEAASQSLP